MNRPGTVLMLFVAGSVLSACSNGCGSGESAPVITGFTCAPSSLPLGGGTVTLSWSVTGATGLSIAPTVGLVTPFTSGNTTTTVTVTTEFTLTASNLTGNSTATATCTVTTVEVIAGTVVDNDGQPIPGETVRISSGAFSQNVVTDADGGFSMSDVPLPYVATLLDPTHAVQYLGLTRTDPTLTDFVVLNPNRTATVSGQFTGGTFPETSDYTTAFFFASPQTAPINLGDQASGSYTAAVTWNGPPGTTGTLYALQTHNVAGLPADFPGFGTLAGVALTDTGSVAGQNVPLSAAAAGTLSGTVIPAGGYAMVVKTASLVSSEVPLRFVLDLSAGTSFSYVTPSVSGSTLSIGATTKSAASEFSFAQVTGLPATDAGLTITVPASPTIASPVDGATGVTLSTSFQWSPYPGGVYLFNVASGSSAGSFYVVTASTTATIPDLADAGLPLLPSSPYIWQVVGYAPATSTNDFAGPGGVHHFDFINSTESLSVVQSFTSAGP